VGGVRSEPKDSDDDVNLLLYIMIPLVAIAAFLFLVLIVCIVCHLCQRKTKAIGSDGVPVIFADELQSGNSVGDYRRRIRPVLADEVRPNGLPPPEYAVAVQHGSGYSTLRSTYKASIKSGGGGGSEGGKSSSSDGEKSATPTPLSSFRIQGGRTPTMRDTSN